MTSARAFGSFDASTKDIGGLAVETTNALLQEDELLADDEAFSHRGFTEHRSPEHALLFAILVDTLRTLTTTRPHNRRFQEYQEAYAWLMSDDETYCFSFVPICQHLSTECHEPQSFNPTIIRRGIQAKIDAATRLDFRAPKASPEFQGRPRPRLASRAGETGRQLF